jgi:hypothetical protein
VKNETESSIQNLCWKNLIKLLQIVYLAMKLIYFHMSVKFLIDWLISL